jgi:hypothetical protein
MPLWAYLRDGGKRALAVWHRRAGKDEVAMHHTATAAALRVGNYVHCLPEYEQGRRAIWSAVNPHTGKRRIDEVFPPEARESTNEQGMFLRLNNGSTWSVIGSDRYDTALVGTSIAGVVFSEYALANPSAWAYTRPVLEENEGWAIFITTPRGRNHAFEMYKHASHLPGWFCELLTAEDTEALTREQLAEALAEYVALYGPDQGTAQYKQEYLCDWQAAILGAFYALEMATVRTEGRIVPIEAAADRPVHRSWDLGMRDDTCVWFFQANGPQIFVLDVRSTSGASLEWWRDEIARTHERYNWKHGDDYVPHDAKVKELGTGRTRVETMKRLGLAPLLVPDHSVQDGINAVRRLLPICVFHPRCEDVGIAALEQYKREWDDDKKAFRQAARHDWCSDRADSFRYLAMGYRPAPLVDHKPPPPVGWRIPPPAEPRAGRMVL